MKIKPRWIIQYEIVDKEDVYQESRAVMSQTIEDEPIEELADPSVGDEIEEHVQRMGVIGPEEDVVEEGGSNDDIDDEEEFQSYETDTDESEEFDDTRSTRSGE